MKFLNGWQQTLGDQGDRDLKFFDVALASLKKQYQVDDERIYVTGHSNGGSFTYLLWAERGNTFAAFAPAAAIAHAALQPKPAMHIAGENDQLVKFRLQQRMMETVRKLNGCEARGTEWGKSGTLVATRYPSKTGTPFISVIYPGPHALPPEVPALIVKFFKEQAEAKAVPEPVSGNTAPAPAKPCNAEFFDTKRINPESQPTPGRL